RRNTHLELLNLSAADFFQRQGAEPRIQVMLEDPLLAVDGARFLAIRSSVFLDEPRSELLERGNVSLLLRRCVLSVPEQLGFPLLAPELCARLRGDRGLHPLPN